MSVKSTIWLFRGFFSALFPLLIFGAAAIAEVPRMIQYQGRLTDDAGNPLDTVVEMSFAIMSDSVGGIQLWKEVHSSVVVNDGLFDVLLGSVSPLDVPDFTGATLWLGIAIGEGDLMVPRTPMVSSAYAIRSENAGYAATAGHADTADYAIIAGHSTTSQHADTADVALNGGANGWTDAGSVVHLSNSGDMVGIGTETPDDKLHLYTDVYGAESFINLESMHATNWGEAGIRFQTPQNIWRLRMDDDSNDQIPDGAIGLRSQTVGEVMTWTDAGKVGIGTTGPYYRLEVTDDGDAIWGNSSGSGIGVCGSSNTGFGGFFSGPKHYFSGLTGFGTQAPTHRITVNGSVGIQQSGTTKFHLGYYNNGFNISETTIADYRLYIKEGGNVGIGTSNPTKKLHVNGDLKVVDTVFAAALSPNVVNADNITDEPGVTATEYYASDTPPNSWTTLASRTIAAPASGYALVVLTFQIDFLHPISGTSSIIFGITDIPDSSRFYHSYRYRLGNSVDSDIYRDPITIHRIFVIPSAGDYTYYFLAQRVLDNGVTILNRDFTVIYIPSAYGSIDKSNMDPTENEADWIPSRSDFRPSSNYTTDRPLTFKTDASVEDKLNALIMEVEELRAKVKTLEDN